MKPYTMNGIKYFFEVFTSTGEPFILLSNSENASDGIAKIYFLDEYIMKYAMEDFLKYESNVKERNTQRENEVR